ncbi:MAG: hypothetical protein ABIA63_13095, partial [bacterium]
SFGITYWYDSGFHECTSISNYNVIMPKCQVLSLDYCEIVSTCYGIVRISRISVTEYLDFTVILSIMRTMYVVN